MGDSRLMRLWRAIFRRSDMERELHDELKDDIARREAEYVCAGHAPDDAARLARQDLGGVTQVREACREVRPLALMESIMQDGRYALRSMRKNLAFSIVAVVTFALGIGATTAIFTVVDGVLLRPIPLRAPDELCVVWQTDRDSGTVREPASVPDYTDYRATSETFLDMAALLGTESTFATEGMRPARVDRLAVTESLAPMLGVEPVLGRSVNQADVADLVPVVVLSEPFWRSRFNADPGVLGRTVQIDDEPHEVIGVLPREASFGVRQVMEAADYGGTFAGTGRRAVDLWTPLPLDPAILPRQTHPIFMLGRLAPGATVEQAQLEMDRLAADLEARYPENNARGVHVEPYSEVVLGQSRPALLILLGAVGLVLLVACVNVVNLLLARSSARGHEIAIRSALGAGAGRLARQFFVESAVLSLIAAAAGVGLAYIGLESLLALAPADLPRLDVVTLDRRVLAVTLGVAALAGLFFGMAPALKARRFDLRGALTASERSAAGTRGDAHRSLLVVAEITLAVILVSAAGLLIRSFWSLQHVDPGFRAAGVLKAEFTLPEVRYPRDFSTWPDWPAQQSFMQAVTGRLRAAPSVQSVALTGAHPVDRGFTNSWAVVGREAEAADWPEINVRVVSAGYFETVGLEVSAGRGFLDSDDARAQRVGLINQAAVDRYFSDASPIGETVIMWGRQWRIVGVTGNERFFGLDEAAPPALYVPMAQAPPRSGSILVRAAGHPLAMAPAVREAVAAHDPQLALFGIEPLETTVADSLGRRRFTMLLLGLFGAVALTLMIVGVHGVLSYAVARQMPELGIMMALGADRGRIVRMVVRRGLRLAVPGIVLGLAGSWAATKVMSNLLYQSGASDVATMVVVVGLVLLACLAATLLPARRATAADPLAALRCE